MNFEQRLAFNRKNLKSVAAHIALLLAAFEFYSHAYDIQDWWRQHTGDHSPYIATTELAVSDARDADTVGLAAALGVTLRHGGIANIAPGFLFCQLKNGTMVTVENPLVIVNPDGSRIYASAGIGAGQQALDIQTYTQQNVGDRPCILLQNTTTTLAYGVPYPFSLSNGDIAHPVGLDNHEMLTTSGNQPLPIGRVLEQPTA